MTDTIFAPLTIKGKCSIYVIRISGKKTLECLKKLGIKKELKHRIATICTLKDKNNKNLDEALSVYFKSPNSFTGEDVCELNLHCSTYIINRVFSILSNITGVRLAEKGEFSKRAFLNGKLDLMQAESIIDIVNAETELQHEQAINQLKGKNSNFFANLRNDILNISSNLEALIDFPEDNIDVNLLSNIKTKADTIIENIKFILNDNGVGQKIKDGLNVSIIGKPNVGKSSFLNFLANKDIAIVSDIAGTTRDVIQTSLDINGIPVVFSDTAGIRETSDKIENEGVRRALKNAKDADLKILILSIDDTELDKNILELIDENTLILLNKIDLIYNSQKIKEIKSRFNNCIEMSLKTAINTEFVIDYVKKFIENTITPYFGTNITQERYRIELLNAIEFLEKIDFRLPIEIISENVRCASFCIGKITGQINTEEILNSIFSKFCIGK